MNPHCVSSSSQRSGVATHRRGFTLVEILTVIVIIGILAGIAIPAVTAVLGTANNTAIRVEIDVLEQALEKYNLDYGDYPPDFSSWKKVERHFRKAFPEIEDDELKILAQFTHLDANFQRVPPVLSATDASLDPRSGTAYAHYRQCIDPAEALVFCLGGFSSDAKRPFTGTGGPLVKLPTISLPSAQLAYNHFQYNTERDNKLFEFENEGLSYFIANDPNASTSLDPLGSGTPYTYSSDEYETTVATNGGIAGDYSTRAAGTAFVAIRYLLDPFPVYVKGDGKAPLVYFASDSYKFTFTPAAVSGGWVPSGALVHNLNYFAPSSGEVEDGVARPYYSTEVDTIRGGLKWVEASSFQIISPGDDESYGGSITAGVYDPAVPSTAANAGFVTIFPTGAFADAVGTARTAYVTGQEAPSKYEEPPGLYPREKPQLDNISNFSKLVFQDELP